MSIKFYILLTLLVGILTWLISQRGWIVLWNSFFIFMLLLVLVLAQKYIGKIEGLLIAIVPFITGQMMIKRNKKVQKFYFLKQIKFIRWCNKNIYYLT